MTIAARIRAAADPRATVEVYGSSVYAPAHASDVDVLVQNDDPARLAAALGFEVFPTTPPRLHGAIDGTPVDITVVNDGDPARLAGPRDAAALVAFVRDRDDVFQATWPRVRDFVRARGLGRNGLGWFGGLGWAVLLAVPLVTALRDAAIDEAFPSWLRWLSRLPLGSRVGLDGIRGGAESLYIASPSTPVRDLANLSKRHASVLIAEAARAIGGIVDLADDPPSGATLVIAGEDETSRGRYDGAARGLLRELETLGPVRSWGRFETTDTGWEHRITIGGRRSARDLVDDWLALNRIDASLK